MVVVIDEYLALLESYRFKPYAHHSGTIPDVVIEALFRRRLERWLSEGHADITDTGAIAITRPVSWDSEILRLSVARLELLHVQSPDDIEDLVGRAVASSKARGFEYLVGRIPSSERALIDAMQASGFIELDSLTTFSMLAPVPGVGKWRAAQAADIERIVSIARTSFELDRFHSDPAIDPVLADEIYATWARNSCEGSAAVHVSVSERDDVVASFVTCAFDQDSDSLGVRIGHIPLVATSKEFRGRGAGSDALAGAMAWFASAAADIVEVGTQAGNVAAKRVYENAGFEPVASHITLRAVLR